MRICFECDADLSALYPLSPLLEIWVCPICGGPVEEIEESEDDEKVK